VLIQNYFYYFSQIALVALQSLPGVIAVLLLVAGLVPLLKRGTGTNSARYLLAVGLMTLGIAIYFGAFYTSVYQYDQPLTRMQELKEHATDEDCGTGWTPWITSGVGLSNPCEKGCYRGMTRQQEMRMVGFPPWPENRREFQCWVRQGPRPVLNRGQDSIY
jgi:hypothetical protein